MYAAAAMSLSSIFVVSNALRLRRFSPTEGKEKVKGESIMIKTVKIEGMTCAHCQKRVEDALNSLPGIKAVIDLAQGQARLEIAGEWDESAVRKAVSDAGYEVVLDRRVSGVRADRDKVMRLLKTAGGSWTV